MIHFGEAKLLISIGISFCLVSCHQKLGNEAQAASCRVEFCNVQFSSLTFAGRFLLFRQPPAAMAGIGHPLFTTSRSRLVFKYTSTIRPP